MADLTIKYKGQPIVELSESGTKTLKTAGKYCEGDITVEYVKPAGGDHTYQVGNAVSILEVNMDMFETRAVEHIIKKYYYNGVLLPEIPADVLAQYPYAWIRKNTTTGYYNLILTALQPYLYTDGTSIAYGSGTSTTCVSYNIAISSAESATVWTYANTEDTWQGLDSARTVLWSNHDIPNGSATATEIYFEGSEPVLAE